MKRCKKLKSRIKDLELRVEYLESLSLIPQYDPEEDLSLELEDIISDDEDRFDRILSQMVTNSKKQNFKDDIINVASISQNLAYTKDSDVISIGIIYGGVDHTGDYVAFTEGMVNYMYESSIDDVEIVMLDEHSIILGEDIDFVVIMPDVDREAPLVRVLMNIIETKDIPIYNMG